MAALPGIVPRDYLDQDIDSVFQARAEILLGMNTVNALITYLSELFGWSGTKETAIATLFSNQAVLFPAGTRLWFHQSFPPPGWTLLTGYSEGHYMMAMPNAAGDQWFGSFDTQIPSTESFLLQGHLPSCQFWGTADFQGHHAHTYIHTIVDYQGGSVAFERDANGPKAFARYEGRDTNGAGNHSHNVAVNSGGNGWGHNHSISMSSYRPKTTTGIIAIKS